MATSTYKSFLMNGGTDGSSYAKLIDIINYPALGGSPELIDITTLSHKSYVYTDGLESGEAMEFEALYDPDDYSTLKALEGTEQYYAVWFGGMDGEAGATAEAVGDLGQFTFKAKLRVFVQEGDVNAARKMTISLVRSTDITFSVSST